MLIGILIKTIGSLLIYSVMLFYTSLSQDVIIMRDFIPGTKSLHLLNWSSIE